MLRPGGLLRQLVDLKSTAAKIKDPVLGGGFSAKAFCDRVEPLLSLLFDLQESRFTHHTKVFGNVVLSRAELTGEIVDTHGPLKQDPHDPEPRPFTQGAESWYTAQTFHVAFIASRWGAPQLPQSGAAQ